MVQISDLVVFCSKKFLEIEGGYRDEYTPEAKKFYAECYQLIDERNPRKTIVNRDGRNMNSLNAYLQRVQIKPRRGWKSRYGLLTA